MNTYPAYLQIIQVLEGEINALPPNSLMPTEYQLAKRFQVSRVTIRRALGFLARMGLISRQRGQGTVVSPPKITRHIVPMRTIEHDLQEQGLKLETRVLSYDPKVNPPEQIRQRLRLPKDESAGFFSATRLVHDRIICFEQRYFPPVIAVRFDPLLIHDNAVIDVVQYLAGMPITENVWEMQIIPARAEVAKALGIIPGVLILANVFTDYLESGDPVHAGMVFYRIDRVKFEFAATAAGPSLRLGESWKRADQGRDLRVRPLAPTAEES